MTIVFLYISQRTLRGTMTHLCSIHTIKNFILFWMVEDAGHWFLEWRYSKYNNAFKLIQWCNNWILSCMSTTYICFSITEIGGQALLQARWCSGLLSLLLLSLVLHSHNFTLYLIPWISMSVAAHAAYGFVVGQKRLKVSRVDISFICCMRSSQNLIFMLMNLND